MSSQGVPTDQGASGPLPDRALLIAAEKVRIQYRNMPTAIVGSAVICSLMGFALVKGAGVGFALDVERAAGSTSGSAR